MHRLALWLLTTAAAAGEYSCHYSSKGGATGDIGAPPPGSGGASHSHPGGLIFVAFGLLLLYGALRNFRMLRALETSAIIAIRSLAAGVVHIFGKAVGASCLTSPLTRQSCFYYQVLVEKWVATGSGSSDWSMCLRHIDHTKFYLQDATGKVLVDLHQAQLDVNQTFQRVIEPAGEPTTIGGTGPSGNDLRDYLMRTNAQIQSQFADRKVSLIHALAEPEGSVSLLPANFSPRDSGLRLRFTETCLLVDQEYNILGTCLDNPNPGDENDRKLIARGQKQDSFLISCNAEPALEKKTRRGIYLTVAVGGVFVVIGLAVVLN
jgi:hypothetical protein